MTVEGTLSEHEFVRLNRWLFYRRPLIAVLHLAVLGLGLFWSSREYLADYKTVLLASPVLIMVVLFFMMTHKSKLQYRKSRTLRARLRYTLQEAGLLIETPEAGALLPWEKIADIQNSPNHLVVYGRNGQAYVVAKAWFDGQNSIDAFHDAVQGHIKNRAKAPGEGQG